LKKTNKREIDMEPELTEQILTELLHSTNTSYADLSDTEYQLLNLAIRMITQKQAEMIANNSTFTPDDQSTMAHLKNSIDSIKAIQEVGAYSRLIDSIGKVLAVAVTSAL
jgi:hypothetical protein